jgi:D-threo-aldose 1-dehydrogenase
VKSRPLRGLGVTEIGFGGSTLGNLYRAMTDDEARATLERAWSGGVRYFDTAPHYGLGLSERRLGAALTRHPRGEYVLSTKVGRLLVPNPTRTGSDLAAGGFDVPDDLARRFDFSRDGVFRSLESSLERLGVDHVDIVYVHDPDDDVPTAVSQAIPALIELRDQGIVGAVGVGMNQWEVPLRMVRETDVDAVMLAGRWTLVDRSAAPLLDACAERGVAVVAAAPFNSGLLAHDRPPAGAHFEYGPAPEEVLARAHELADICERHGTHLPAAALQFPLRSPAVVSVVVGQRSTEQVASTLALSAEPIPETAWAALGARPASASGARQ